MNSTNTPKIIPMPPWAVSMLGPFIARTVAGQLLKQHPDWNRDQVADFLHSKLPTPATEAHQKLIDQVLARWPENTPRATIDTSNDGAPLRWYSPSGLVLLAANLVPLYGVFVLGWSVYPLLLLYWLENVIIGASTALRMICVDPPDGVTWIAKAFMVPFFCFHYGMFTLVHGLLLTSFFGSGDSPNFQGGPLTLESQIDGVRQTVETLHLGWQVLAIAASHAFSFAWNYLGRGEYRRASVAALMVAPYGRVMLMHVVILIGGFAAQALRSPVWALMLLLALKIGFDLRSHLKERGKLRPV
jgi:Family of unknown function (DUF6498)